MPTPPVTEKSTEDILAWNVSETAPGTSPTSSPVAPRNDSRMLPAAFVGVGCLVAWIEAGFGPRPSPAGVAASVVVVALLMWFALG